jgi:hypothetical protein
MFENVRQTKKPTFAIGRFHHLLIAAQVTKYGL